MRGQARKWVGRKKHPGFKRFNESAARGTHGPHCKRAQEKSDNILLRATKSCEISKSSKFTCVDL